MYKNEEQCFSNEPLKVTICLLYEIYQEAMCIHSKHALYIPTYRSPCIFTAFECIFIEIFTISWTIIVQVVTKIPLATHFGIPNTISSNKWSIGLYNCALFCGHFLLIEVKNPVTQLRNIFIFIQLNILVNHVSYLI